MRNLLGGLVLFFVALAPGRAVDVGGASCSPVAVDAADERVWVLCEESRLFVTEDYAMSWTARPLPAEHRPRAVKFLDARRGYVAGDNGMLLATDDGGYNWKPVALPTGNNLTAIAWRGESGWIAGHGGVIVHTGDGGRTWSLQDSRVGQSLDALYFLDQNYGWAAGWSGTLLRTTNGGHTWEPARIQAGMLWSISSVYFRDRQNGWAVGFNGTILRSTDGGATWTAQTSPVQKSLTAVTFDDQGRGWITADTHLLASIDGGETWAVAEQPANRLFLSWLVRTQGSVWAFGQYGVLKQSPDGVAWRRVEEPARMVVPPSSVPLSAESARALGMTD
jgi:photosystem II stability/assembly factor-like uncharacterized protein